jgi:mxaJ protein
MSLRCLEYLFAFALIGVLPACSSRQLRVCADPNNLPFSNQRLEGFENKIAALVGHDLRAKVQYTWWAQRRGFFRNTLNAHQCDIVMGVPASFDLALPTQPYYRSTYVFVYRKDTGVAVRSLDDPALRQLRVGVQLPGDDVADTPPGHALTRRNIINNVVGFTLFGDYKESNPPARIIDAVIRRDVDVAIVWGPLAGYFSKLQSVPLEVVPVTPTFDSNVPFTFDISIGVRRGDIAIRDEVQQVLNNRKSEVQHILDDYGVPRV